MKIAVHGRPIKDDAIPYIQAMFDHLKKHQLDVQLHQPFKTILEKKEITNIDYPTYGSKEQLFEADFLISAGGDGTLLEAITYVGDRGIPVLGINTGRLGFLATTGREEIAEAIDCLLSGEYKVKERTLIKLINGEQWFGGTNYGLNEFAILKRDTSSMIVVHTYVDGEYLNSYWADGLLVSTPTGSTGYSLSCGGPLVVPGSHDFIIAPVSPHNLNVRPLIISDDSTVSFEVESRSNNFLISFDSRSVKVPANSRLSIKKADFKVKLIELKNYNYYQTLRQKLNWGLDLRN
jgi:NAD+ kinase